MILFALSFIFIFVSSYFIASILAKKDSVKGFIYTLLVAYAQIILTSEILSPFYQLKEIPFLLINVIFCVISSIIWIKWNKPTWKLELSDFKKRFFNALKLDKSLWFLFIPWVIFILISLYLIILLPSTSGDAYTYHVVRCFDWVINHSLAHFDTSDIRITSFPINSELLYTWIILFTKKQLCLGIFTFIGYVLNILCGYHILRYFGYSMRKIVWTFLIFSSFASVVVMISGTETDLLVSGLIVTSIYLFISALKNKPDNATLFMSSLAYAIAIGVKTPAILCIPAVGLFYLYLSFKHKDKTSLLKFIGFGIINFILFSAFNYVQNFISYENIMGNAGAIYVHKNLWGIRGFVANFVKHMFQLIDFSGIRIPYWFGDSFIAFEKSVLTFLKVNEVPNGLYCGNAFFNGTLIEPHMGCGILSFALVLPCFFISLIRPIFCRDRKAKVEFIFGLILLINICVLSAVIVFMTYNTRFLTCFIAISFPILTISYIKSNKNVLKIFYILIAIFYFLVVSTHLWGRPFVRIVKEQIKNPSTIQEFRSKVLCTKYDKRRKTMNEWCNINSLVVSKFQAKNYKILFFPTFSESTIFIKTLKLQGYKYDFNNLENLSKINPDVYDVIVVHKLGQGVTNFEKYTLDKIDYILIDRDKHYPLDPNAEILCYYNSLNGTISKERGTENNIPHQKACRLTTNFFKNHPFKFGYQTNKYYFLLNKNTFKD